MKQIIEIEVELPEGYLISCHHGDGKFRVVHKSFQQLYLCGGKDTIEDAVKMAWDIARYEENKSHREMT